MTRPPVPPFDEGQWWRSHPYHRIATKLSIFATLGREPVVDLTLTYHSRWSCPECGSASDMNHANFAC